MRIVQEQPPIFLEANKVFRLPKGVVMTYGDILYNPSGNEISIPLLKHEELHSQQQGTNPKEWWAKYLKDKDFRLSQEIPAYRTQYQEAKKHIKDRNKLFDYAVALAKDLSSAMYGSAISFQEALKSIRNGTF